MEIYIDESGDLGFTGRSSSFFIIAGLIVYDSLPIQRCFKKIRTGKLKRKYKELPEFKFNNSGEEIKRRILTCIASADIDIAYSVLRKWQVEPHLRDKHQIIYNYLTASLVANIIRTLRLIEEVHITVDKSLNRIQRDSFDEYLVHKTFEKLREGHLQTADNVGVKTFHAIDPQLPITIVHLDSRSEPCLQAVDFIAGALHHYYRTNNPIFRQLFEGKIKLAFDYFEGQQK